MPTLEKIVRPFQTRDITPAKPATTPDPNNDDVVVLKFGENGSGKSFGASYSFELTTYMDKRPKEKLGGGQLIDRTFPAITFSQGQLGP